MYYLARRLYLSKNRVLSNYVVEVRGEAVVGCFPFSGELQSMQLVDALLVSENALPSTVHSITDVLPDDAPELRRAILYKIEQCGDFYSLRHL